jgi:hypothetical protein
MNRTSTSLALAGSVSSCQVGLMSQLKTSRSGARKRAPAPIGILDGDTATAESYRLAHRVWMLHGRRTLMVVSIRYLGTLVRAGDKWLLAERSL